MALSALLAQLVEHLHGKEGVDGSSPSEGFKRLAGAFASLPRYWPLRPCPIRARTPTFSSGAR
jgi:hypothetical protein